MINMDDLINRLNSDDRAVLHETIELLGDMRDKRAIKPIVSLLKGSDQGIKDAAVNALVNIGGQDAADAVIPLLYEEDNASLRNMAIEILERLGKDAEQSVIALLNEKDDDIVKFALDILGNIGNPALSPHLIPVLNHPNKNVRAAAVNTVSKLKVFSAAGCLIDMLKDNDEWVRFSVIEALGSLGSPDMVDRLLDAVKNYDMSKIAAIDALSHLAQAKDLKKIMSVISSLDITDIMAVDTAVRFVERFLTKMDDSHKDIFLKIFTDKLKNGDLFEKRDSLKGIGLLGKRQAIDALLKFAEDIDENDEETVPLLRHTIASVGSSSVIIKALRKEPANISILAEALGDIGDPSSADEIKSLIEKVDRETRAVLLKSLEKIETVSSFETISSALRDKDGHIRGLAAAMLGKLGDSRAIPLLYDALIDEPYKDVQEIISDAMSMYAGDEVKDLFVRLLSNEQTSIRIAAIKGLGRLNIESTKKHLMALINDLEPDIRIEAVKSLGSFEGGDVTDIVSRCLKDENKGVRLSALEVIRTRDGCDDLIIIALSDADMWVRFRAIEIIADKKIKGAEDIIIDILLNDGLPVKAACINALGHIGSKESEYVLKGFIDHIDPYISAAARDSL
ncbi:MAG: HEAT repeat domain-containing protein [Deltaproteobacteria bacterium]|nr:HEAT repeat domain-containing protein [Deltaproteobacteria bacterium]